VGADWDLIDTGRPEQKPPTGENGTVCDGPISAGERRLEKNPGGVGGGRRQMKRKTSCRT
jgi:hypothetical protein